MSAASNDLSALSLDTRRFLDVHHGHLIGGEWVDPKNSLDVIDPSSGAVISSIANGDAEVVDAAVNAAWRAFNQPSWKDMPPLGREKLILKLAELIESHANLFAELESVDNGMPLGFANLNVHGAAGVLRYMAGWPSKIVGDTVDVKMPIPGTQFFGYTTREPVGVVAAIVPWNVPLMMAIWKLGPALAAGCTIVIKPAEDASLTTLLLAGLVHKAGFPPGVINIITGTGAQTGEALVKHPLVAKISFTGSTRTGKHINNLATETLKKVTLELGGKSPTIIFDDANIENAIVGAANSIFTNAGQICVAGSRLYVQRGVFERVVEGVVRRADGLRMGAGLDDSTEIGPLINARQQATVNGFIQRAVQGGATVATQRSYVSSRGYYVPPTILTNVAQDDAAVQDEIFGPVLAIMPFDDLEEAAFLANDNAYGLAASVWSENLSQTLKFIPKLKCGKVSVNTEGFPYPALPEGGTKQSGYGRDLGKDGLDGYLETKTVLIRVS